MLSVAMISVTLDVSVAPFLLYFIFKNAITLKILYETENDEKKGATRSLRPNKQAMLLSER